MLELISYGSSSKGNCHILYNGFDSLMLDCGVNMKKYNYDVQKYNIKGLLISHCHSDHCKGLKNKTYLGNQNVYANKETLDFLGNSIMEYQKKEIKELKLYKISDNWSIIPIRLLHDVENYGFIIKDNISGMKIAYLTDLGFSENLKISGINIWIIECNHIRSEVEKSLEKCLEEDDSKVAYYKRVLGNKGHLSLEDSCRLINNNYNLGLKDVILCHISNAEKDYKRYEELYINDLKSLEMPLNGVKIHSINNKIVNFEEYMIIEKNKWEDVILE
jgi:phosphoribosyl 1,2-cyclic phosphodiesterase